MCALLLPYDMIVARLWLSASSPVSRVNFAALHVRVLWDVLFAV